MEASQRKAGFLERVVERLDLSNAGVLRARAEELPGQGRREAYGVVVVRAVAPLATLVEYAAPLLAEGGRLLAWKGARDPDEEAAGGRAAPQLGLEPLDVRPVTPYSESRNRHLHLYRKVRPCPPEFPRRVGRGTAEATRSAGVDPRVVRSRTDEPRAGLDGSAPNHAIVRETGARPPRVTTWGAGIVGPEAMATVYAVANQKGGVGKTTTAVNLAACVSEAGCRTLLVDLDPQCNATVALGMPKDVEPNTYSCLLGQAALTDAARPERDRLV